MNKELNKLMLSILPFEEFRQNDVVEYFDRKYLIINIHKLVKNQRYN